VTAPGGGSLNRERRARELAALADGEVVDVLVVGGGVTGAGVALDAACRGLSVALVEAEDLAFGTSRWSSKLVHGGLRYLAAGDVGLARESAVERDGLLRRIAPHLVRPMPMLLPLLPSVPPGAAAVARAGLGAADLLCRLAGTPRSVLPGPRRLTAVEAHQLAPAVRTAGLRGGLLSWDGQLADDARLVVAIARTAAALGARVLTRVRAVDVDGSGARVLDTVSGDGVDVRARAVVVAAGVWAGRLLPEIRLRPSRGTHLVVDAAAFGGLRTAVTIPFAGERNRYALVLPQPDGRRVYVGLTDVPVDEVVDVPAPCPAEIDALLAVVSEALQVPLDGADVLGGFAGLRPLLDGAGGTARSGGAGRRPTGPADAHSPLGRADREIERSADLSRRHAIYESADGVVSVVGGKLTTYRRMAQDAVDAAVRIASLDAGPCRTRNLPLLGAAPTSVLASARAPERLVRLYGTQAADVLAQAGGDPELLAPVCDQVATTGAELLFAVRHEGALDVGDLLDRRSRVGLVPAHRAAALPRARALLDLAETRHP
jgi:glycerol-3-phosphate dehydrogenase